MKAVMMVLVVALAAAPASAGSSRRLSDADLVRLASAPFDKRAKMFKRELIGLHRGKRVMAWYPCGDVCPIYTRRILYYDVPLERCTARGGAIATELVPRAISVARQDFCKPTILARPKP